MKIDELKPKSFFASLRDVFGITLFFNRDTETVCYREHDGTVVEVGSNTSAISSIQDTLANLPTAPKYVLKGFANQVGTAAPTINPLVDTINGIVWSYVSPGIYKGTKAGAFPFGKTVLIPPTNWQGSTGNPLIDLVFSMWSDDEDSVYIMAKQRDGLTYIWSPTDDLLYDGYSYFSIEIWD